MTRTEELLDQIHLVNEYVNILPVDIDTLEQLVELCRLQHEALKMLDYGTRFDEATEAIAAFERFEQGDKA